MSNTHLKNIESKFFQGCLYLQGTDCNDGDGSSLQLLVWLWPQLGYRKDKWQRSAAMAEVAFNEGDSYLAARFREERQDG